MGGHHLRCSPSPIFMPLSKLARSWFSWQFYGLEKIVKYYFWLSLQPYAYNSFQVSGHSRTGHLATTSERSRWEGQPNLLLNLMIRIQNWTLKSSDKTGRPQTHLNLKSAPESTRVSQVLKSVMVRGKLLPHLCRCDQAHYYQYLTRLHKYHCNQTESYSWARSWLAFLNSRVSRGRTLCSAY